MIGYALPVGAMVAGASSGADVSGLAFGALAALVVVAVGALLVSVLPSPVVADAPVPWFAWDAPEWADTPEWLRVARSARRVRRASVVARPSIVMPEIGPLTFAPVPHLIERGASRGRRGWVQSYQSSHAPIACTFDVECSPWDGMTDAELDAFADYHEGRGIAAGPFAPMCSPVLLGRASPIVLSAVA